MRNKLQIKRKQRYAYYMNIAEQCVPEIDEEEAYLYTEFEGTQEGEEQWDKQPISNKVLPGQLLNY